MGSKFKVSFEVHDRRRDGVVEWSYSETDVAEAIRTLEDILEGVWINKVRVTCEKA